jgi:hypothetical protein
MSRRTFAPEPEPEVVETPAPEVTLVELVTVLASLTEDENEIFATVDHMIEQGSVRIAPTLGRKLPEAC